MTPEPAKRWRLSNLVSYISLIVYLGASVYLTASILSAGKDPAILFLLWIIFAGWLALQLARSFHVKSR
jgi:hypothetical protein